MENLEDVSSGGRVTRSLRKRLTSIDSSDSVSRSNTPIQTKLGAISELNSPLRATRMSRRNSMSGTTTPVKTPATSKSLINAESNDNLATPIRRSNRKRSNSIADESSSKKNQVVIFDQLPEEQVEPTTSAAAISTRPTTRSQSQSPLESTKVKSPNDETQPKKRGRPKPATAKATIGPKSRLNRILDKQDSDDSDPEVIILKDDDGDDEIVVNDLPLKQNIATRTSPRFSSNKKDTLIGNSSLSPNEKEEQKFEIIDLDETTEPHEIHQNRELKENTDTFPVEKDKEILQIIDLLEETKESHKIQDEPINEENLHLKKNVDSESPSKTSENSKGIKLNSPKTIAKLPSNMLEESGNEESIIKNSENDFIIENESKLTPETHQEKSNGTPVCIKSVVRLEKLSPEVISRLTAGKEKTESFSQKKRSLNSKSVAFNEKEEDEIEKCVYPKTPTLTKNKNYIDGNTLDNIDDKSFHNEDGSITSFKDTCNQVNSKDEILDDSKKSEDSQCSTNKQEEDGFDLHLEETPLKPNLMSTIQSSTPLFESVSKKMEKLVEESECIESNMPEELLEAENEFPAKDAENFDNSEETKDVLENETEKSTSSAKADKNVEVKLKTSQISNNIDSSTTEKVNNEELHSSFSKSWTQNVSGKASSNEKIDTISDSVVSGKNDLNLNAEKALETNTKGAKQSKSDSNVETNESVELKTDDDESISDKCEMIEDEAIEANEGYKSGDSMDSEERREIEENEIVDNGESIGSNDTVEYSEEEEDEEKDSFVTSDSEELQLEFSDNEEDLIEEAECEQSCAKTKIFNVSSSESELENLPSGIIVNNSKEALTLEVNKVIDDTDSDDDCGDVNESTEKKCTSKSDSLELLNKSDEEKKETTEKSMLSGSKKNLSNARGSLTKSGRKSNINIKAIETSSSDEEDNPLSFCQSLNVQRNEIYESSDEENNANEKISLNESATMQGNNSESSTTVCKNEKKSNQIQSKIDNNQNSDAPSSSQKNDEVLKILDEDDMQTDSAAICNENIISEIVCTSKSTNSSRRSDVPDNSTESINSDNQSENETVIPETQQENNESSENSSEETKTKNSVPTTLKNESTEDILNSSCKKVDSDVSRKHIGLSKSFSHCKSTKDNVGNQAKHHSFTIGVTVTKTESHEDYSSDSNEEAVNNYNGSKDNVNDNRNEDENIIKPKLSLLSSDEEQELEKLSKKETLSGTCSLLGGKRQSLAAHSQSHQNTSIKNLQRKSMQALNAKIDPSRSLIESIEERKSEFHKEADVKKRLSKSIAEVSKELMISTEDKVEDNSSNIEVKVSENNKKEQGNRTDILKRCDEILDAANRAKLEAKLNYKKSKIITAKDKKAAKSKNKNEGETYIPKQTKKEMKHSKDKTKLALKQAIKASAQILMNDAGRKKTTLPQFDEEKWEEKRLPIELLDAISSTKEKLKNENEESTNIEHQPKTHVIKSTSGDVVEEILPPQKKKKTVIKTFELPTGIVYEEPVTPKREEFVSGFRVSPVSPPTVGFKVRHILSAGQDTPPTISSSRSERKRRRRIEEPKHILPKPQWSQSGVFIEEEISNSQEISRAGATEFVVSKLNGSKKNKNKGLAAGTAAANALNFKNSIMNRSNCPRETTHEALMRKARQVAHRHF